MLSTSAEHYIREAFGKCNGFVSSSYHATQPTYLGNANQRYIQRHFEPHIQKTFPFNNNNEEFYQIHKFSNGLIT